MPAVLDSKTYPHLVSRIISFAPWPARLRLRATCRSYRDAITRDLMEHVAVSTAIEDKWPGRQAFYKEKAARSAGADDGGEADKEQSDPAANDRDAWKDDYPEIVSVAAYPGEAVHVLPFSLEHDRTIDYPEDAMMNGDAQNNCIGHSNNTFFPNKRTIRLLQTLDPDFEADNLVAFVSLPYEGEADQLRGSARGRFVLHLRWDAGADVDGSFEVALDDGHARAQLVLWPPSGDEVPDGVLKAVYGFVVDLVSYTRMDGEPVTVVGADELGPAGEEESFKAAVKGAAPGSSAGRDEKIDKIRFVSREAWLEELGEDREAVGVWPIV